MDRLGDDSRDGKGCDGAGQAGPAMITDLLMDGARCHPDKALLLTDDGRYSYGEMAGLARRFAGRLRGLGIGRGDHVAILADNSAAYLVAWFGICLIGGVAVTLNNQLVSDGLRYSVEQSDAKAIVADRSWIDERGVHLGEASRRLPLIVIDSDRAFIEELASQAETEPDRVAASDTCAIIYTSGTTGLPKGVMNSHNVYLAIGREVTSLVGLTPDDVIMAVLPLFHANTQMFGVMPVLTVGGTLALKRKFSAASFFSDAARFGATGHPAVGTIISILLARYPQGQRDHRMRFCIGGGISGGGSAGTVMAQYRERFGIRMYEGFGMTEIGGLACANSLAAYREGSCGKPRYDMELRVVDEYDREMPVGQQGEIVVRPKAPFVILSGYYGKPDLMVEACRNLWFHTGDRGSFDADGFLYFHGRFKELIRRKGEMISPVEIETKLRDLAGVEDCAVVAVPDDIVGEEIKAVVVTRVAMAPAAVRDYLQRHFPAYMLPRYVEFLPSIPKTETEKIQRRALQYVDGTVHDLASGGGQG
jgi:crotonobetaine/carnitine-CoA ligase